jgi:hypothetical protein
VSVDGTLAEDKMRGFKGECAHFSFNKNQQGRIFLEFGFKTVRVAAIGLNKAIIKD